MKFKTMRFLDRYVGPLALCILYLIILPLDLFRRGKAPEVKTILVQKYLGVGSLINAIPLFRRLRTLYPKAHFVIVTFPEQASFLELTNLFDEILIVDNSSPGKFLLSQIRTIAGFWRLKPKVCLDLEFFSKFSMIMSCLSGASIRVGFYAYSNLRSPLLTHPVSFNHYNHISEIFFDMADVLASPRSDVSLQPDLPSTFDACKSNLEGLIGDIAEAPIVTVNVNSSMLSELRSWSPGNFTLLLERFLNQYPSVKFVLIGSPSEADYVNKIARPLQQGSGRLYNIVGKTTYADLMAIIEKSHLLVTNDSGPAHIASAFGIHEIVLFGPETPVIYAPLNPKSVVLYKPPHCSPCLNVLDNKEGESCENPICLTNISVDEVFNAAVPIIDSVLNGNTSWKNAALPK